MRLSRMQKVSVLTLLLGCSIAALAVAAVGTEIGSGAGPIQALLGSAKPTVTEATPQDTAGHPAQHAATAASSEPVLIASNSRWKDARADDGESAVVESAPTDLSGSVDAASRPASYQFESILDVADTNDADAKEADSEGLAGSGKGSEIAKVGAEAQTNLVPEASQCFVAEVEPNATCATATPLGSGNVAARGDIYLGGDIDVYSFSATAGDRIYAATMTSFSASSADTTLSLLDGSCNALETDTDDGSIGTTSSSIAGTVIPSTGTYYLRVSGGIATAQVRPYHLHLRVQSGSPAAEVEANDSPATANVLPASGWVSGAHNPATDADFFSFSANAGDTVYLSLDADPERDAVTWNPRLGIFPFGPVATPLILVVDDTNVTSPNSEALFMTVKNTGTYYAYVDTTAQTSGGATQTYHLSVSIHPACPEGPTCTTYTSTDVPKTIGPAAGLVSSTILVPGNPRIADLDVAITLTHLLMGDIDAHLRSPAGNDNGLFTDIGALATATSAQTQMDIVFDDDAGMPPLFTVLRGADFQPELAYRLHWFDGENAGGVWTLDLRDDTTNGSGGTLSAWSITICEPPPAPTCAGIPVTVYTNDFEAGDGGFTHSGVQDEWARGLPTFAPVTGCNSGTNCWKTDLTGTYNASSNQDLVSSTISLLGLGAPIQVNWAQKYQMESASFDTFSLQVREPGPTNVTTLYQFLDATMTDSVGSPAVTIQESAGWGQVTRSINAYANKNIQLKFNLTSDVTGQFAGLAIDDVTVTACCTAASCDDGNPCTDDTCSASGCSHSPTVALCSDGNPCTSADACIGGVCVGTPNTDPCNDNNPCTSGDVCGGGTCAGTPNTDPCSDGNPCTSSDACSGGSCVGTNNTDPCTDGNPCTLGDVCSGGVCVPGPAPTSVQFCSSTPNSPIVILDSPATASPYPSIITASGLGPYLCKATVNLNGVTHSFPDDIDILLSAPGTAQNLVIMSDAGGGTDITAMNLTLDDAAANPLSDAGPLVAGTFKPTDVNDGADTYPAPAPAPTGGTAFSVFTGSNPNGQWKLFVKDDAGGDTGSIAGWCLNLQVVCAVDADCLDTNLCTTDTCVAGACVHTNNTDPCNDGNACTSPDTCSGGTCVGTPNTDPCNDGNPCTSNDTCSGGSCVGTNNTDPCSDGNPCTSGDVCSGGVCSGTNNTDPCSDGNLCTIGDVCSGGVCVPGPGPLGTATYCSTGAITVLDAGAASPYPSNISVPPGSGSVVCKTTVDLAGITHTFPDDLDLLLVAPGTATNAKIMSDVGGGTDVVALSLTLNDGASASLPDAGPLVTGTFKPTDIADGTDVFPPPAPAASGGSALSAFNGSNPTGTWKLYVVDDAAQDTGSIAGWCINITTVCLVNADCIDTNPCTDDTCVNAECVHANNTAPCDDGNACTANDVCGGGTCAGTPITAPSEVQGVMVAPDKQTISWSPTATASRYDVLRGGVAGLPVGPGGGDEFCFDDVVGTSLVDVTIPAAGASNWYVVRAENCGGNGTYGSQSNATPRTSTTCP